MRALPALALAVACGAGLPAKLSDCKDDACQARWVEATWGKDPKAVATALAALSDPIARVSLVRQLTTAHPGEALPLCDLLPRGPAAMDCRERNKRPHLLAAPSDAPGEDGPGPETHGLSPSRALVSPWAQTRAEIVPCAIEARVCQSQEASTRAAANNAAGAAAACNGVDAGEWRDECYFQAGEQAIRAGAADDAVGLCMAAGTYAGRCLSHVVREVGALAPVATASDAASWTRLTGAIDETGAVLARQDPDLAARFTAQAWAWGLRSAYARSDQVIGTPLALLPAAAVPHARAAAAWRLWDLEQAQHRTLAAWTARLAEVLADTSPHAVLHPPGHPPAGTPRNLWTRVLPGEEALPSTAYLGPSRRATATDAAADGTICLLEAMAHSDAPPLDLIAEGLGHADPIVRWTAVRLLLALSPGDARRGSVANDTNALVRARAAAG